MSISWYANLTIPLNARYKDEELSTDKLRRQMGRVFASNLVVHASNFGSEIGYCDWTISWFSSGPPVIPQRMACSLPVLSLTIH